MKKQIYIILFIVLGVLLSFILHAVIEIYYIDLLVIDFLKYSFGFSWSKLYMFHKIGTLFLFILGMGLGLWQGKYWWKKIYIDKIRV
ncbi:MAG: hypothetical protein P1P85_04905 [Patescibacteria group bacterium]|nr:hypothetical protein [Patescibacteria group bacterium]